MHSFDGQSPGHRQPDAASATRYYADFILEAGHGALAGFEKVPPDGDFHYFKTIGGSHLRRCRPLGNPHVRAQYAPVLSRPSGGIL